MVVGASGDDVTGRGEGDGAGDGGAGPSCAAPAGSRADIHSTREAARARWVLTTGPPATAVPPSPVYRRSIGVSGFAGGPQAHRSDKVRKTPAYAATSTTAPLAPFTIERRETGPRDLLLDVLYCGICHTDIHQTRDEWGGSTFPMVPGHEIVGRVREVGREVTRFQAGDLAGVGCIVDSCGTCDRCRGGLEQFCALGPAFTYNSTEMDRKTPTYGGYSTQLVVTERFAFKIPAGLDPAGAAPLLCAGITTYSPLRQWRCQPGDRVGVVGLGGLGHMAVKLAASMEAEVTVFSTSRAK